MEGLGSRLGKGIFQEARKASLAAAFLMHLGDDFLSNCSKTPLLVFVSYFVSEPKRGEKIIPQQVMEFSEKSYKLFLNK